MNGEKIVKKSKLKRTQKEQKLNWVELISNVLVNKEHSENGFMANQML